MTEPDPQPDRTKRTDDDETLTADEARAASLPDDSPLRPGAAAHTVDPATGEEHTGQ